MKFDINNLNNEMNNILKNLNNNSNKTNLFLHVCCAPCSTIALKRLIDYFNIYIVFYNPNIDTKEEYDKRYEELKKFINDVNYDIKIIYIGYNHNEFLEISKGLEDCKEGGLRCEKCFNLRLKKCFEIANEYIIKNNLAEDNYLTTTLTTSPYKNPKLLYEIGIEINKNYEKLKYLPSDFKKENGYLMSVQLSNEYGLYRQDYCGCEYSKIQ